MIFDAARSWVTRLAFASLSLVAAAGTSAYGQWLFVQPPSLERPEIKDHDLKAGETAVLKFSSHPYNPEHGAAYVYLFIQNEAGETVSTVTIHKGDAGWKQLDEHNYEASFQISSYWPTGRYAVSWVNLYDDLGNSTSQQFDFRNHKLDITSDPLSFHVTATNPDTEPPAVLGMRVAKSDLKAGDLMEIEFDAYDTQSGLKSVDIAIGKTKNENRWLKPESVKVEDKKVTATYRLNPYLAGGTYKILRAKFYENSDPYNKPYLSYSPDANVYQYFRGFDKPVDNFNPFAAVEFKVTPVSPDLTQPEVLSIRFNKKTYQVGERGTATMLVKESGSGVDVSQVLVFASNDLIWRAGLAASFLSSKMSEVWLKDCSVAKTADADVEKVTCHFDITTGTLYGPYLVGCAHEPLCRGQLSLYDKAGNHNPRTKPGQIWGFTVESPKIVIPKDL